MARLQRKKTTVKKKANAGVTEDGTDTSLQVVSSVKEGSLPAPKKNISAPAPKAAAGKRKKNFLDKSLQFLREVKVELKKVTWPSRKQTMGSTLVVIILVIICALYLGLVDFGLSNLLRFILK